MLSILGDKMKFEKVLFSESDLKWCLFLTVLPAFTVFFQITHYLYQILSIHNHLFCFIDYLLKDGLSIKQLIWFIISERSHSTCINQMIDFLVIDRTLALNQCIFAFTIKNDLASCTKSPQTPVKA